MPTVEELEKMLEEERKKAEALELSKKRLEEESKKYKSRAQLAEEKVNEAEREKLEKEGKLEELLAKEREEKNKALELLNQRTNLVLSEKLKNSVASVAKDAHNIELLLKLPEAKDFLKIDEDSLTVEGVEDFVAKARESNPFLFKKAKMDSGENVPPNGKGADSEANYLAELKKVTTREELLKLKQKYNKI